MQVSWVHKYTISQDDIVAGSVTNTATVTGTYILTASPIIRMQQFYMHI